MLSEAQSRLQAAVDEIVHVNVELSKKAIRPRSDRDIAVYAALCAAARDCGTVMEVLRNRMAAQGDKEVARS